jgi:hypothetical protein
MGKPCINERHVFHYATHSVVWTITRREEPGCAMAGEHVHTPDGLDVQVCCFFYLTRDDAERIVSQEVAHYEQYADVLGTITVLRHTELCEACAEGRHDTCGGPASPCACARDKRCRRSTAFLASSLPPPPSQRHRGGATGAGPCPCDCNRGGFCGGCGHAGCGGR